MKETQNKIKEAQKIEDTTKKKEDENQWVLFIDTKKTENNLKEEVDRKDEKEENKAENNVEEVLNVKNSEDEKNKNKNKDKNSTEYPSSILSPEEWLTRFLFSLNK